MNRQSRSTRRWLRAALVGVAVACLAATLPVGAIASAKPEPFRPLAPVPLDPQQVTDLAGTPYFVARSVRTGVSLFRIDPATGRATAASTLCARTDRTCSPHDFHLAAAGGALVVSTSRSKGKIWTLDGSTQELTRTFKEEIRRYGPPTSIRAAGGRIVVLHGGSSESTLATADPGGSGWSPVTDAPVQAILGSTAAGAVFYVTGSTSGARELHRWRFGAPPVPVATVPQEWESGLYLPFTVVGEDAYFSGFDPEHGSEPWYVGGSADRAVLLGDLSPGTASTSVYWGSAAPQGWVADSSQGGLAATGGTIRNIARPERVFGTPGTPAGTFVVRAAPELVSSGPADGIWRLERDGTATGPFFRALSVSLPKANGWVPAFRILGTAGTRLYFFYDGDLWGSDGTTAGTQRVTRPGEFTRVEPSISLEVTSASTSRTIEVTVTGTVALPAAASALDVCRGPVRVSAKRGGAVIATKIGRLKRADGVCRYALTIRVSRQRLGSAGRGIVRVETAGSGRVAGATSAAVRIEG